MSLCQRRTVLGSFVLVVILSGCGGPKIVKVNGTLLKDGQAMVVSEETYVTISFVPESTAGQENKLTSHSAKFEQKTGKYSVEMPAGNYRTMVVVALPAKKDGKLNAPTKPVRSDKVHELTSDQELDIEISAKK